MSSSTERKGLRNGKVSRPIELARYLRSKSEIPRRRFRIELADDLFAIERRRHDTLSLRQRLSGQGLAISGSPEDHYVRFTVSKIQLAVGLAAIAGFALGYLLDRRK